MRVWTFSNFGYEGSLVQVEVDLRKGIPAVDIVGLADGAVKEARERVRSAIQTCGLAFPQERVLVSLSPADLRKEGAQFDLPLAIGILAQTYKVDRDEDVLVLGELELSGLIRPVHAVYSAVSTAVAAGIRKFIVPQINVGELKSFDGIEYISAHNLSDTHMDFVKGNYKKMEKDAKAVDTGMVEFPVLDENEQLIDGYEKANRALVIAAAGGHNMLFYGQPGCGKTLVLQTMKYILPLNTVEEAQPTTRIWSLAGLLKPSDPLVREKPFRMPHQTATIEGICGGGVNCRPGEISLAHNGVLFFDEAAEFRSSVLQMLRVPLESESITLSRAGRMTVYPAHFQLLMATNPCPCGNYGSKDKLCLCSAKSVEMYWKKFSAPLLNRIDIRMRVEKDGQGHLSVDEARALVSKAVAIQRERGVKNCDIMPQDLPNICVMTKEAEKLLEEATERYGYSPRAINSVMKVARTIADIDGSEKISKAHMSEAIKLRGNEELLNI